MNSHHPASARLPPETLQTAIRGLMALREMELKEVHRLVMTPHLCSSRRCILPKTLGSGASDVEREVINQITGPSQSGTKILQVFPLNDVCGSEVDGFCKSCEAWWESEHADVRKEAWAALPSVFGLRA